ncbi:MAG: hypothetical protein ABSG84_17685 [Acidobacteriaceae bacterium]|jgi:hypothetical protein
MQSLSVATLVAALSFPIAVGVAQSAPANSGAPADSAGTTAPITAQSLALIRRYMISVETELTSRLDSRNAAAGQPVTAKTLEPAKLADGTALPRGTRLDGHVIRAQAHTQDQPYAMLSISFDRAELKNGQSVALRSEIRMVAPPASVATTASVPMMADQQAAPVGAGTTAGGGVGTGGARSGAGAGGGISAGPMQSVGQTAATTLGGAADGRAPVEVAADTPGVVTQAGETASAAPRSTALPGVVISTAGAGDASGILMASGRNISLDTGCRITLGLITR